MILNLILAACFIGGIASLWYRISYKIPELVAVPDEVIVRRLHEDSARVRIFLLHIRTFWREPRYRDAFRRWCEKIIVRAHIGLLRLDNALVGLLKHVRGTAQDADLQATATILSEELTRVSTGPPPVKSTRIHPPTREATGVSTWRDGHFVLAKREAKDTLPVGVRRVHEVRRRKKTSDMGPTASSPS